MNIPAIDWIDQRKYFFTISGLLCAAALAAILTKGFNYGIDFTGGTVVQVTYPQEKALEAVRADLVKAGYPQADAQSFGGGRSFALYLKGASQDVAVVEQFVSKFSAAVGAGLVVDRKEFVGPTVGRHLKKQAATAIVLALLAIIIYIAFRFDNPLWGAAAVSTIAHDILLVAGLFAALQVEVDLVIVAAFLTIAGYAINDTIVIFDRMRERMRLFRGEPLRDTINSSINEMKNRTLMTNGMVLTVVACLFVLGGPVIHNFALAMLLGAVIGTYSTIAISCQLVYLWKAGHKGTVPSEHQPSTYKVKEGRRRK